MRSDITFLQNIFENALKPKSRLWIDEWAEENLNLPSNISEPGRYSLARTPYMREPLRYLSPQSPVEQVIMLTGAQVGKTQTMLTAMMFHIGEDASNQLYAMPTDEDINQFLIRKLNPLIDANPLIKSKLGTTRKNASGNSMTMKEYNGYALSFPTSTKPNTFRSTSAPIAFLDELDTFRVTSEGSPWELVRKRLNTFGGQRKMCASSTPINNRSQICDLYESTDKEVYKVPCPHCHSLITLDFDNMEWEGDERYVKSAWINCPECGNKIFNSDKQYMLDPKNGAHWEATEPLGADPKIKGFYLPSLYSPPGWLSFESIAQQYLKASKMLQVDGGALMSTFYNTVLAKQYQNELSTMPDPKRLASRGDNSIYRVGDIPASVLMLTCAVDVQQDRLECDTYGWEKIMGRNHLISHEVFQCAGDDVTANIESPVWDMLYKHINKTYFREDGVGMVIRWCAVDCAYQSDIVYAKLFMWADSRVIAIHGKDSDNSTSPYPKRINTQKTIASIGRKAVFYAVPSSVLKTYAYSWLMSEDNDENTRPYICMFPRDLSYDVYQMTCAEKHEPPKGTNGKWKWIKIRKRNECLDLRAYNIALYYHSGMAIAKEEELAELERSLLRSSSTNKAMKRLSTITKTRRILNDGSAFSV